MGWVGAKMILMSAPSPFLTLLTKRMDGVKYGLGMGRAMNQVILTQKQVLYSFFISCHKVLDCFIIGLQ